MFDSGVQVISEDALQLLRLEEAMVRAEGQAGLRFGGRVTQNEAVQCHQ